MRKATASEPACRAGYLLLALDALVLIEEKDPDSAASRRLNTIEASPNNNVFFTIAIYIAENPCCSRALAALYKRKTGPSINSVGKIPQFYPQ